VKYYVQMRMKITKIVATRCQILRPKCTKFDFGWGSPQTPLGELTSSSLIITHKDVSPDVGFLLLLPVVRKSRGERVAPPLLKSWIRHCCWLSQSAIFQAAIIWNRSLFQQTFWL